MSHPFPPQSVCSIEYKPDKGQRLMHVRIDVNFNNQHNNSQPVKKKVNVRESRRSKTHRVDLVQSLNLNLN